MTTNTVRDTAELLDLKRRIEALPLSDQFRWVADLVDQCRFGVAETLGRACIESLAAKRRSGWQR